MRMHDPQNENLEPRGDGVRVSNLVVLALWHVEVYKNPPKAGFRASCTDAGHGLPTLMWLSMLQTPLLRSSIAHA